MTTFKDVETPQEIELIASWYSTEWNLDAAETRNSLGDTPNKQVCFQRMMLEDGALVGTGGLYFQVGIQKKIDKYKSKGPWIGLMYTTPEKRGRGLGQQLLNDIELEAKKRGFAQIYLFTHTAESLYRRSQWKSTEQIKNGDKIVFVMEKTI